MTKFYKFKNGGNPFQESEKFYEENKHLVEEVKEETYNEFIVSEGKKTSARNSVITKLTALGLTHEELGVLGIKDIETNIEKQSDQLETKELIFSGKFFVNVTSKGKNKVATIHSWENTSKETSIEYDKERGDRFFDTIEEAQKYAESFN